MIIFHSSYAVQSFCYWSFISITKEAWSWIYYWINVYGKICVIKIILFYLLLRCTILEYFTFWKFWFFLLLFVENKKSLFDKILQIRKKCLKPIINNTQKMSVPHAVALIIYYIFIDLSLIIQCICKRMIIDQTTKKHFMQFLNNF